MHFGTIMGLRGLCIPVGLIGSLMGVFYCFGVFEVQDLTLLPREPVRAQSAPITRVAALPPSAANKATVAAETAPAENRANAQPSLTPPVAPLSMPSVEPAQAQLLYGAAAAESAQYQQQLDVLPGQAEVAETSTQTELLNSGVEGNLAAVATEGIEPTEPFEPTAVQNDQPQQ